MFLPKKRIEKKKETKIICEYSERKKKAKVIDEYSTLYPETISDSPSVKSKGDLLVSAKNDI